MAVVPIIPVIPPIPGVSSPQNYFNTLTNPGQRSNMGLGALGLSKTRFKRKFRWVFLISPNCNGIGTIGPNFVKVAARPNYDIEEQELNFLNAKTWIAGKITWQSISVTFIDANAIEIANLYRWLGQNGRIGDDKMYQGTSFDEYAATAELVLYDGCGNPMEVWGLDNVWPQAVNFGELDYSSSEEATIEVTLRYDKVKYLGICPNVQFQDCCFGCTPAVASSNE